MSKELNEIINSPFSTPAQVQQAKEMLAATMPAAPVIPADGNLRVTGVVRYFPRFAGKRVFVLKPQYYDIVISPSYGADIVRRFGSLSAHDAVFEVSATW